MEQELKRLFRSWMFVPGNKERMVEKALALPVDAIIFDLEDGVALTEKENARARIAATLDMAAERRKTDPAYTIPVLYVRINAVGSDLMVEDLKSLVRAGLNGLVVPKVETVEQVRIVERELSREERAHKVPGESTRLLIAIESPIGLFTAYEIAKSSPRIIGLQFGSEDFSREMNLPFRREGEAMDLLYARSAFATACAAARVQAVDGVWVDINDRDGLRRFALQARRLGMSGMSLIHPSQIEDANAAFSPAKEEVDYARDVLAAFDAASKAGQGAVAFRGQMLDSPVVDRARQTMALAKTLGIA